MQEAKQFLFRFSPFPSFFVFVVINLRQMQKKGKERKCEAPKAYARGEENRPTVWVCVCVCAVSVCLENRGANDTRVYTGTRSKKADLRYIREVGRGARGILERMPEQNGG